LLLFELLTIPVSPEYRHDILYNSNMMPYCSTSPSGNMYQFKKNPHLYKKLKKHFFVQTFRVKLLDIDK